MDVNWGQVVVGILGGGLIVKLAELGYQHVMGQRTQQKAAQQFVEQHLDPLLKATDELVAKLRSLADRDFQPIYDITPDWHCLNNHDFGSLAYLFGIFWARIERIRHDGMSVQMAKNERGKQLKAFLDCIESRRMRIVDRIQQRAIGECLLNDNQNRTFIDFVTDFEGSSTTRRWMAPLLHILSRTRHRTERQQLLVYATVLHAMIDTLDPDHHITGQRPSVASKLSKRSWTDLKFRVFRQYLTFVEEPQKYLGPPKAARRR